MSKERPLMRRMLLPCWLLSILLYLDSPAHADDVIRLKCQVTECRFSFSGGKSDSCDRTPETFEAVIKLTAKKVLVWGVELNLIVEDEMLKWAKENPKNVNIYKYVRVSRNTLDFDMHETLGGGSSYMSKGSCTKIQRQI